MNTLLLPRKTDDMPEIVQRIAMSMMPLEVTKRWSGLNWCLPSNGWLARLATAEKTRKTNQQKRIFVNFGLCASTHQK